MQKESQIIPTYAVGDVSIKRNVDFGSLIGRKVVSFESSCGTYGMGGPGFAGFKLEASDTHPEEWLILCLWGSDDWLTVNGRWLGAHPDQYHIQKPMVSNFSDAKWDEFSPLVIGSSIDRFDVAEKSCEIKIGDAHIVLSADPNDRPVYVGTGQPRGFAEDDDLRQAWILASAPWVQV